VEEIARPRGGGGRVIRVVLTGSESTGKSTLGAALAKHYGVSLVPEFVRGYAESRGGVIEFSDHGPIARGQIALEDEHVARGGDLVVQDTDLLSTVVYCRHYFGRCPEWIEAAAAARRPALYLLCEIDVPWVRDGVRDRGDRRDEMQMLFREAVRASGVPSIALIGDPAARLSAAIEAVEFHRVANR
jgi:NadR type nicotinamide-nucleotide adenylyltransferase